MSTHRCPVDHDCAFCKAVAAAGLPPLRAGQVLSGGGIALPLPLRPVAEERREQRFAARQSSHDGR